MTGNIINYLSKKLSPRMLVVLGNWWRPYRGAGIKIIHANKNFTEMEVEMKLRWFNKNYVGTHFGGSLYAMTDPFYMMMLIYNVGDDYVVWDKSARIEFKKPGRSRVTAKFKYEDGEIEQIKAQADLNGKYIFNKHVDIIADDGEIIASVEKEIYIRRK
jgi:hypothetical protein